MVGGSEPISSETCLPPPLPPPLIKLSSCHAELCRPRESRVTASHRSRIVYPSERAAAIWCAPKIKPLKGKRHFLKESSQQIQPQPTVLGLCTQSWVLGSLHTFFFLFSPQMLYRGSNVRLSPVALHRPLAVDVWLFNGRFLASADTSSNYFESPPPPPATNCSRCHFWFPEYPPKL